MNTVDKNDGATVLIESLKEEGWTEAGINQININSELFVLISLQLDKLVFNPLVVLIKENQVLKDKIEVMELQISNLYLTKQGISNIGN